MHTLLLPFLAFVTVTLGAEWVDIVRNQQETLNACLEKLTGKPEMLRKMVIFASTSSKDFKNLTSDAKIIFDTVSLNVGGGYNTTTGDFTAPEPGFYKFEWTHVTRPKYYFITKLMKNGEVQAYNHPGSQTDYESATQSIILHLNVGDKVWLEARGTSAQEMAGGQYSTFNGFKLGLEILGDKVWLEARGTSAQEMAGGQYSTFNGFKL